MKKATVIITALIIAIALIFTGCGKKDNLMNDTTTTAPSTTKPVTTEKPDTTTNEDRSDAGVPESTSLDSAIGNAAEDIVDGAGDIAEDIGDAAERAGDRIENANDRIANDIRDAQN